MTSMRVLVTGATRGIGAGIVSELVAQIPSVHVLLGARDPEQGEKTKAAIVSEQGEGVGSRISVVCLDVTSDESVKAAAAIVGRPLYGVINNAGINQVWTHTHIQTYTYTYTYT